MYQKLLKTIGYVILLVAVILGIIALFKPKMYEWGKASLSQSINKKFLLSNTHTIGKNDYMLEVYTQSNYSSFVGLSSSSSFSETYVILKDKQGKVLLEPHWYASCDFMMDDFQLELQERANRIYFTEFDYIDLTTMSFDCY